MNRLVLTVVLASTAVLAACGSTEVVIQGQVQMEEGQAVPLSNLPVRLLPYDRDAIFDSLATAYTEPEPAVPAELTALRDSIAQANQQWTAATARWNLLRDSLQRANDRLAGLSRASGEYVVLFREVNALFEEEAAAQRQMDQAFSRFSGLQDRYQSQAETTRLAREQWEDAAYADVERVIASRLREMRMAEHADTLDANGVTRYRGLEPGEWWVTARYELPYEELYWNIPINVQRGEPTQVQLTRQTAEVRPKL
ncbi:MAG TPA: hypothetical protein VK929_05925 [Longimicrobiales bacterium]|nr:hypothetical protein [Longimicrobiales bacterium]